MWRMRHCEWTAAARSGTADSCSWAMRMRVAVHTVLLYTVQE